MLSCVCRLYCPLCEGFDVLYGYVIVSHVCRLCCLECEDYVVLCLQIMLSSFCILWYPLCVHIMLSSICRLYCFVLVILLYLWVSCKCRLCCLCVLIIDYVVQVDTCYSALCVWILSCPVYVDFVFLHVELMLSWLFKLWYHVYK